MFTKQLQGLLLHANINQQNCLLIKWYLPEDICQVKNNLLTFSQNSESLATWIQSKKDWCCTEFSYYYKGKISLNSKIRETFWFRTTLIAFILAYIVSIMWTGFLMANTCVHK